MDKYIKKELIGSGSDGNRVYKVLSKNDNKFYAMKKVFLKKNSEKDKKNCLNEILILENIKHDNMIQYYDSFIKNEKIYIITEFADGGDLKKYIREHINEQKFIEEGQIWIWIFQIASAISFLHLRNIIHRDIKSENIFLTNDMNIKLGDFGISKILESSSDFAETGIGTPFFLSPEICDGQKYNFKSDIWMLGCLIFELCFLKRPFEGESINMIMLKIIKSQPEYNSQCHDHKYSKNLIGIITDCLKKSPEERPNIESIFIISKNKIRKINEKFLSSINSSNESDFSKNIISNQSESCQLKLLENKSNDSYIKNEISETQDKNFILSSRKNQEKQYNDKLNNTFMPFKINRNRLKIEVDDQDENEDETLLNMPKNFTLLNLQDFQYNKDNVIKSVNFNSKTFLEKCKQSDCDIEYHLKNFTPSYCKEDMRKILKNLKISPVNNSLILNENKVTDNLCAESTKCIRRNSTLTSNSISTTNSLQTESFSKNLNNMNKFENKNQILCYKNRTTRNNPVYYKNKNFNFGKNNFNNYNNNIPTPDSKNIKQFKKIDYNNINNNNNDFDKLNGLKKGHIKTISINISSIQSPEHNAVYEIENIEGYQNIEFPKMDFSNKFSSTPTNVPSMKNKNISNISPKLIRDIPKITKEDNSYVGYSDQSQSFSDDSLIAKFMIEKFGQDKFNKLKNCFINDKENPILFKIDEENLKKIVGIDQFKTTVNYMKQLKSIQSDQKVIKNFHFNEICHNK